MTTATHRTAASTGRPIAPAAANADRACMTLAKPYEAFYDSADQLRARIACRRCPVLTDCLREGIEADESLYVWGIVGGLTADQRRALRVEALLGQVPDLAVARILARGQWSYRLRAMLEAGMAYAEIRERLEHEYRVKASRVTVRVAVWWLGGHARLLPRPAPGDHRREPQRVREDQAPLLRKLQEAGVCQADIAAYLEMAQTQVQRMLLRLNTDAAKAATAAAAETVGLAA